MSHDTLTEILAAAPQLAVVIILYIWHREDTQARERQETQIIKTLSQITKIALSNKKEETTHG